MKQLGRKWKTRYLLSTLISNLISAHRAGPGRAQVQAAVLGHTSDKGEEGEDRQDAN